METLTSGRSARLAAPFRPAPQLSLLGGFELRYAGETVPVSPSGQRVLALLALQRRAVERTYVAGVLWLDAAEPRAAARLRSALWRLPQPGGASMVEASVTHLRLADAVAVDYRELTARAEALDRADGHPVEELAPASLSHDLLPDWYEDWLQLDRERFRQLRLHALEALCSRLTRACRFGPAVQAGLAAVAGEPLRESAHRRVIEAHLAEGNPTEAVRQYRLYRRLLADELDIEPSAAIRRLVDPLQR